MAKRTRIMVGVLGVSALALVADRLVPAESSATPMSAPEQGFDSDGVAEATGSPTRSGPTLADRFTAFDDSSAGDRATITAAFSPLDVGTETPVESAVETAKEDGGLRLSAILRRDDGNIAVINGRPMREGQQVDGIRVVAIDGQQVHLMTDVGAITLDLGMPTLQSK